MSFYSYCCGNTVGPPESSQSSFIHTPSSVSSGISFSTIDFDPSCECPALPRRWKVNPGGPALTGFYQCNGFCDFYGGQEFVMHLTAQSGCTAQWESTEKAINVANCSDTTHSRFILSWIGTSVFTLYVQFYSGQRRRAVYQNIIITPNGSTSIGPFDCIGGTELFYSTLAANASQPFCQFNNSVTPSLMIYPA